MLRREALVALRAYTRLPESIQGILERRGDEYDLGGGISRSDTFDRALSNIDADVFCVSKIRIMKSATESAGVAHGSFVLRGKAVRLEESMFAVVSVIAGAIPEDLRSSSNVYLLTLEDGDFLRCSVPQQLPYGVNTVTDALAPRWNYVSALFSKKVQHAVISCPNGIFSMKMAPHPSDLTPSKAEALIKNLLDLDVVIEVEAPRPKTIYRLATNCLFVGAEGAQDKVAEMQRNMQLPSYIEVSKPVPTSLAYYSIDSSILQTEGPRVEFEVARSAAPQGSTVQKQSLSKWWSPLAFFDVTITIRSSSRSQETSVETRLQLKEGPHKEYSLDLKVKSVPLRETQPGENSSSPLNQLRAIIESSASTAMTDFSSGAASQASLDKVTRSFGEILVSNINTSYLFESPVTAGVKMSFNQTEGDPTTLPSGDSVVVPKYSYDLESPRLNSFLGIFSALGLQGTFTGWTQATRNRVMVL